jgi:hypothetical protein
LIYVHRCPLEGCVVREGQDDSRTDTSSIASGTRTIGAFTRGDAVWQQVMDCVRATYAPFNIGVTDIDPGAVPHFEHIVGGRPTDLDPGLSGAGGVSPFTCGEIPNAITYTFDIWGSNAAVICGVVAQETAHAFGLEHELNPSDPLTYLNGPYPKRFQATDTECGEFEARPCDCGGSTQNSYEYIVSMFGPGIPTAPSVAIASPSANKQVQPHFVTRVEATDDVAIDKVELLVDGNVVAETREAPYKIVAPDLPEGPHTIEARAYDVQGTPATSAPVAIELGPPCTAATGCSGDDVCVMGGCLPGPEVSGGLGHTCQANTECLSGQCLTDSNSGDHFCVEGCDLAVAGSCPSGFSCIAAGPTGVCWPDEVSGCCDTGVRNRTPVGAMLLGLGLVVLVLRRRR